MGLLSGLESLGFKNVNKDDIYKEEKAQVKAKQVNAVGTSNASRSFDENDMIFDKTCKCPVCEKNFTYRAVKSGKARRINMDDDLRPVYEHFDPLKYDVIVCTGCGYAAVSMFFDKIVKSQADLVKAEFAGRTPSVPNSGVLSYDDAILRHRLALASAIVKKGKGSEKSYTCLKLAWMLRGKYQTYPKDSADYAAVYEQYTMDEEEALLTAFEGFEHARAKENFPIAGMDTATLDYLMAALAYKIGKYDKSEQYVKNLLVSPSTNSRIKDRARDLKEKLKIKYMEQKNQQ